MHSSNTTTCNGHNPNSNSNPIPLNFLLPTDYDICSSNPNELYHPHHHPHPHPHPFAAAAAAASPPDSIINAPFPHSPDHAYFDQSDCDIFLPLFDLPLHYFSYNPNPLPPPPPPPPSHHNEILVPPTPPNHIMKHLHNNSDDANTTVICCDTLPTNAPTKTSKTSKKFRSSKKDRHSKINTANGPRDRRMRLSLDIARKFFSLQDLLGFDKASRTVDWLIKKSGPAIRHLARTQPGAAADLQEADVNYSDSSPSDEAAAALWEELPKMPSEGKRAAAAAAKKKRKKKGGRSGRLEGGGKAERAIVGRESRRKARERARERTSQKRRLVFEESIGNHASKLPYTAADLSLKESTCNHPSAPAPLHAYRLHFENQVSFHTL